jgi:hypothetical protein
VIHCSDIKLLINVLDMDEIFIIVSPNAVNNKTLGYEITWELA